MSRFKNPVSVVDKFGVQPVCLPQQQILGQTGIDLWKTYLQNIINQNIKTIMLPIMNLNLNGETCVHAVFISIIYV